MADSASGTSTPTFKARVADPAVVIASPESDISQNITSSAPEWKIYTNLRIYTDGQSKDSQPSPLVHALAILTIGIYAGWMHILILASLFSLTWFTWWVWPVRAFLALAIATLWLPAKPVYFYKFLASRVFSTWRRYFNFSVLFEEPLDLSKHYIFAEFPHGTFPLGPIIANTMCAHLFPTWPIYAIAASSVFNIPLWRHFLAWIGSVPATAKNFKMMLKKGTVAVIPGGIAEMYDVYPDKEMVKLKDRKGFVRIAVETGHELVPLYYFGNSQIFSFGPQFLQNFARRTRASVGILYGKFYLPIPHRVPLFVALGRPVPVRQVDKSDPTFEAYVSEVHERFTQELQGLYDRHKASYGWENRPLEIN